MLVADAILTLAKPIPSNEQQDMEELHPELCFRIVRNPAAPEYLIQDYLYQETITVPMKLLKTPHFNLGRWYEQNLGQEVSQNKTILQQAEMGHAISIVVVKLLVDGSQTYYPSRGWHCDPASCFVVRPPHNL